MGPTVCDGDAAAPASAPDARAAWELPAVAASVGTIRGGVRDFARERGVTDAILIDLALAVTEAVTNSVVHAFIGREPGSVWTRIEAAPDELVVVVTDDGRGMQPRADSPGLGLGLPTIASLTTAMDMHAPPGGGTVITMTFAAPGVRGAAPRTARGGAAGGGRADRRGDVAGGGRRAARRPAGPRVSPTRARST